MAADVVNGGRRRMREKEGGCLSLALSSHV